MKRIYIFAAMALLLAPSCSKYDDSTLTGRVDDLENRVDQLEQLCRQMNTNISSLQTLVTTVQGYDYVTDVTPIMQDGKEIGYTISFTKSSPITIYHGKDGEKGDTGATGNDGHTPVIGVRQDNDGIYYWTVDGNWLTDKKTGDKIQAQGTNGQSAYELAVDKGYTGTLDEWLEALKGNNGTNGNDGKSAYELAVEKGYSGTLDDWLEDLQGDTGADGQPGQNGITPKLKIENGYWYVSYDKEHQMWEQLGKATGKDGDPMFQDVDYKTSSDYVIFTLFDGTTIHLPKMPTLAINFTEGTSLVFQVDETKTVHYTITGGGADNVIKAEMLNSDGAYTLRTISSSATAGTIEICTKVPTANRVIVSVSDGSHTIMAAIDVSKAPFDGKTVTVTEPGTLADLLAGHDKTAITELIVIGPLNNNDIKTLNALPNLSVLDMEKVNLEELPDNAFDRKKSLTSIVLPKTLKIIGKSAFYICEGLTGDLTIPEGVTTIGNGAFAYCTGFTGNLTIPEGVTTIGNGAFDSCSGFTGNLTIPEGVTKIGDNAFSHCEGFTGNLTIPEGVTTIGYRAFSYCTGFTGELTIPNSVTTIGDMAFSSCSCLTGELTIPNSVTAIGDFAFTECFGFTGTLIIPENVTTIGEWAFQGCSGFTGKLIIPRGITTIGDAAFQGCSGFTGNLTIPEGVTTIGNNAFFGCTGITNELTIPSSVTKIGDDAFSNCALSTIYCKPITPPKIIKPFLNSTCTLYVPMNSAEAYRTASGWNRIAFQEIIETEF